MEDDFGSSYQVEDQNLGVVESFGIDHSVFRQGRQVLGDDQQGIESCSATAKIHIGIFDPNQGALDGRQGIQSLMGWGDGLAVAEVPYTWRQKA